MPTPLLPYLIYLFKMLLVSAILLGYYRLFLRKTAASVFNRFYLLASVFLALGLPLLHLPLPIWSDAVTYGTTELAAPHITLPPDLPPDVAWNTYRDHLMQFARWVCLAYVGVTLFILVPFVRSLFVIRRLKRQYTPLRVAEICVYPTREAGTPFSFFNHLFWNEDLATDTEKGQLIFRHELYHIRQLHTIDILALETICRLFWCNPFFFVTLRELKMVHEFLADRYAIDSAPDADGTKRATYAARWLTAPLALCLVGVFAARSNPNVKWRIPPQDRPILQNSALTQFYLHNLRYPKAALEKGMEGSVWINVEMDASGHRIEGGGGTRQLEIPGATTLTITSRTPDPQQKIGEPAEDTAKLIFVEEALRVSELLFSDSAVSCQPGMYYFSVVFKIEK